MTERYMHTPGPWLVCVNSEDNMLSVEQDREAMERNGDYSEPAIVVMCVDDMGDRLDRATGEANARLIAAAPTLLEACEMTLLYLEQFADPQSNELWVQVAAAIREATTIQQDAN